MIDLTSLLIRLHGWLLRLYPASYRHMFGDEMRAVFELLVWEAPNPVHALLIGLRELRDIPPQAWQEHTRQRQQAAQALPPAWREVQRARQLVRVSSLLINIAFLLMVIPSLPHLPRHSIPAHVVLVFMPVISIIAWRWERQGGILLLAGAALLTAAVAYAMSVIGVSLLAMLMAGIIWAIPFAVFGWLFYRIGHQAARTPSPYSHPE
jgi:hypothetical protein